MERPRIDKYHLLKSIGKGGMAEVYLAFNPGVGGLGKFVALKKMRQEFNLDPKRSKLFRREAEVAIKLNHPGICAIYEVGEQDGSLYLVMEFIPGIDLRTVFEYYQQGIISLTLPDIIHLIISIASGLAYAHDFVDPKTGSPTPVIHCDLCPQNIRVTFEGATKIIDFGIAKIAGQDPNTQTDPVMGKVEYVSPEQIKRKKLDCRADLYSLGIILWEFLSKKRYFDGEGIKSIHGFLQGELPPKTIPSDLPHADQLQKIVAQMIAHDPNNRFSSAEALEVELRRFSNKNFPEYFPHQFRDAIQTAFSDQIHLHQKIMAKMAASVQSPVPQTERPAPTPSALSKSGPTVIKAQVKGVPKVETLFEAVQILNQPAKPRRSLAHLVFPVLIVAILAGLWVARAPRIPSQIPELNPPPSPLPLAAPKPADGGSEPTTADRAPSQAAPSPNRSLRVTILSDPPGADVWIDGVKMYRRTPALLPLEPERTYELKLIKKGYQPHEGYFESRDTAIEIKLRRDSTSFAD